MRRLALWIAAFVVLAVALSGLPELWPDHGVVEQAIFVGDQDRVRALLARGADPNSRSAVLSEICWFLGRLHNPSHALPELGEQPPLLSIAITHNQPGIARMLAEAGADPNARDERGYTPLSYAALSDDPVLVRLLLERGANAKLEMPDGSTPLREGPELKFRTRPSHPEIVRLLREATDR